MQGFVLKGMPFHQTLMRLLSAQAFVLEQQQRQRRDRDNWRRGCVFSKRAVGKEAVAAKIKPRTSSAVLLMNMDLLTCDCDFSQTSQRLTHLPADCLLLLGDSQKK